MPAKHFPREEGRSSAEYNNATLWVASFGVSTYTHTWLRRLIGQVDPEHVQLSTRRPHSRLSRDPVRHRYIRQS